MLHLFHWGLFVAWAGLAGVDAIEIVSPPPRTVFQRQGYVPREAHPHAVGGPARGFADVDVVFRSRLPASASYLVRAIRMGDDKPFLETSVAIEQTDEASRCVLRLPAGGWYRVELEGSDQTETENASVEPVGVGEVFLIAGQSYATNTNDEMMSPTDIQQRVVAWDFRDGTWRVANDPQPTPDGTDGGSIWPPLGDDLAAILDVPIGFANVAWGGTSSTQWLPGGELHQRLVDAGRRIGRFRAVLWQQGESDVIGKSSIEQYVANLTKIRQAADDAWIGSPRWLLAKSTLHPTVYSDPSGESRIRHAIDQLIELPGFAPGPDTDLLDGDRRGPMNSRRHFSGLGQRQAAKLWFQATWAEIQRPRPEHDIARAAIKGLHLLDYPWTSAVIHGESSILLVDESGSTPTARLAFPAAEILEVRAANGAHRFVAGKDFELSGDGRTLRFSHPRTITPFRQSDLYLPKGSPGSYEHRVGHPDQSLLYAPGRGMHDRAVEITYRRRDGAWPGPEMNLPQTSLPKTRKRLAEGGTLRIGVSGDSISFGWDASRMSDAPPYQCAYPGLVAAQINETFGSEVELVNRAISGWSVANGVTDLPKLLESNPDLIIVAYGMNDVGRRDPAWFGQQTRAIVESIKEKAPEAEIILVASMLGNREWSNTPAEMFPLYRDELKKLISEGVALADVTAVWQAFLASKHDLDLSGNGLNHPNDFGHRLYAQAILSLLTPPAK